jgi:hypothetical protein
LDHVLENNSPYFKAISKLNAARAGRNTLEGQFDFSSRVTDDNRASAHMMTFRLSFAIQAAVTPDAADFAEIRAKKPELFFEPGFLCTIPR